MERAHPMSPMTMHAPTWLAVVLPVIAACNGTPVGGDATADTTAPTDAASSTDTGSSADAPITDGGAQDVASTSDANGGDGGTCMVADGGPLQSHYYCDLTAIHVLQHTGGTARVAIQGRIGTNPSCGAVDSIDVMRGSTVLARLAAGGTVALGNQTSVLITSDAPSMLVSECTTNMTTRLTAYGLVVRGRDANGPFEADCGTSDTGGRWPPGTSLLCHQNLDQPPSFSSGMLEVMSGAHGVMVTALAALPHASGAVSATSIDSTVGVVSPERSPFNGGTGALSNQTSPGWTNAVSESSTGSPPATDATLAYFGPSPPFDPNLCPPPGTPGPTMPLPPYFILQVTGQGPAGPEQAQMLTSCLSM